MSSPLVKWEGYLVVAVTGIKQNPGRPHMWSTSAKAYKNKPAVDANEVAFKVSFEIPAAVFQRPQFEARISVPADSVVPLVVNMEVRDNVEDLLRDRTGFNVKLLPVDPLK